MKKMILAGLLGCLVLSAGIALLPVQVYSDQVDWQIELKDLDGEYYSRMSEDGWSSMVRGSGHGINGTVSGVNGTLGQEVNLSAEGSRFERAESGTVDGVDFSFEVIVEGENGITIQEESQYLGDNFVWGAPAGEDFLLKSQGMGFIYWRVLAEKPDEVFEKIKVSEAGTELLISNGTGLLYAPNPTGSFYSVADFDGNAIFSPGDTEILGVYADGGYGSFAMYVSGDEHIKATIEGAGLDEDIGTLPETYFIHGDYMRSLWFDGTLQGTGGSLLGPSGEQLVGFDFEGR